jgi:hypothetical protein
MSRRIGAESPTVSERRVRNTDFQKIMISKPGLAVGGSVGRPGGKFAADKNAFLPILPKKSAI